MSGAVETGDLTVIRHPVAADREEFLERVAASVGLRAPWVSPPSGPAAFEQ